MEATLDDTIMQTNDATRRPFSMETFGALCVRTISLAKLRASDEDEIRQLGEAMSDLGVFYLDLSIDPDGIALSNDVASCCKRAKYLFESVTASQKHAYHTRGEPGAFDLGYVGWRVSDAKHASGHETLNIPVFDLMSGSGSVLPAWLQQDEKLFRSLLERTYHVGQVILGSLETALALPKNSLTELHQWERKPSHSFLRLLHYFTSHPQTTPGDETICNLQFPAHRDYSTLSILWTWVNGLQMLKPDSSFRAKDDVYVEIPESEWMWVRPRPQCAIVNCGWMLEKFTDSRIRAAWHRVVIDESSSEEKYSVLVGMRAHDDAPMTSVEDKTQTTRSEPQSPTCHEWTVQAMSEFIARVQAS